MTTDLVKIEKGIPLPSHGNAKYPWAAMEIGDSFLVTHIPMKSIQRIASAAGPVHQRKFSTRTVDGGIRVWRIA